MRAPAGAVVGIYVDLLASVALGDVIETRSGRRYLVLENRVQARGKNAGRQHLRCAVLGIDDELATNTVVHRIRWYRRGPGSGGVKPVGRR